MRKNLYKISAATLGLAMAFTFFACSSDDPAGGNNNNNNGNVCDIEPDACGSPEPTPSSSSPEPTPVTSPYCDYGAPYIENGEVLGDCWRISSQTDRDNCTKSGTGVDACPNYACPAGTVRTTYSGCKISSTSTPSSSSVYVPPTPAPSSSSPASTPTQSAEKCGGYCKWPDGCYEIASDPTGQYGTVLSSCAEAIANCQANGQVFGNSTCSGSTPTPTPSSSSPAQTPSVVQCESYCKWPDGCYRITTDPTGQYGTVLSSCAEAIANCQAGGQPFGNSTCSAPTQNPTPTPTPTPTPSSSSPAPTPTPTAPGVPTIKSLDLTTNKNGLAISWGAVSGASSYNIYRASSGNASYTKITSTTGTAYDDIVDFSRAGLSYYYKITAVSSGGSESNKSKYWGVTTNQPTLKGYYLPKGAMSIDYSAWYTTTNANTVKVNVSIGTHSVDCSSTTNTSSKWEPEDGPIMTYNVNLAPFNDYTINLKTGALSSTTNMTIDKEK